MKASEVLEQENLSSFLGDFFRALLGLSFQKEFAELLPILTGGSASQGSSESQAFMGSAAITVGLDFCLLFQWFWISV